MADINKEQALKDAKILLDTIGILSSKSGRQTVGGTQYSWQTHNEIGNTVAELDKILNKYTSSYTLNLLEEAYLEINQKSKRFVSDKEKLRIRELKKNNPKEFSEVVKYEKKAKKIFKTLTAFNGNYDISIHSSNNLENFTDKKEDQLDLFNTECEGMCGV